MRLIVESFENGKGKRIDHVSYAISRKYEQDYADINKMYAERFSHRYIGPSKNGGAIIRDELYTQVVSTEK